uniref:Putative secreted protein n=1 Tax=Ixodes ricinus TaxID=34613 RepID=A0A6B0UX90_IXORI
MWMGVFFRTAWAASALSNMTKPQFGTVFPPEVILLLGLGLMRNSRTRPNSSKRSRTWSSVIEWGRLPTKTCCTSGYWGLAPPPGRGPTDPREPTESSPPPRGGPSPLGAEDTSRSGRRGIRGAIGRVCGRDCCGRGPRWSPPLGGRGSPPKRPEGVEGAWLVVGA